MTTDNSVSLVYGRLCEDSILLYLHELARFVVISNSLEITLEFGKKVSLWPTVRHFSHPLYFLPSTCCNMKLFLTPFVYPLFLFPNCTFCFPLQSEPSAEVHSEAEALDVGPDLDGESACSLVAEINDVAAAPPPLPRDESKEMVNESVVEVALSEGASVPQSALFTEVGVLSVILCLGQCLYHIITVSPPLHNVHFTFTTLG